MTSGLRAGLAAAVLFAGPVGCAALTPWDYGQVDDRDTHCGQVGNVAISLRLGVDHLMTCDEARTAVTDALERVPVKGRWTIFFTNGAPGWDLQGERMEPVVGMTYPAQHGIEVRSTESRVLVHEFRHALEFDEGVSNGHMGWREKGWL